MFISKEFVITEGAEGGDKGAENLEWDLNYCMLMFPLQL